jgi:hypothetical protein
MPTPLGEAAHVRYPPLSDLGGEHRTKPVPPEPDCLVAVSVSSFFDGLSRTPFDGLFVG